MESDALHQASLHKLSSRVVEEFPPPEGVTILEEDREVVLAAIPDADIKS
jgi:hypothetical protein